MTKDMKKVFLDIPNSYKPSEKAPIDFYLAKTISLLNKRVTKQTFVALVIQTKNIMKFGIPKFQIL